MWIWAQRQGSMKNSALGLRAAGYSGHGDGINNPALQSVHGVGPVPVGSYRITEPHDSPNTGPYTLGLEPSPGTQTFGRGEFRIHGDIVGQEGRQLASHGCIILPRSFREEVWNSADHDLAVVADENDTPAVC